MFSCRILKFCVLTRCSASALAGDSATHLAADFRYFATFWKHSVAKSAMKYLEISRNVSFSYMYY